MTSAPDLPIGARRPPAGQGNLWTPEVASLGEEMAGADHLSGAHPIVYVDRSDVHEGSLEELKEGISALVGFIDAHQPQMTMYAVYLDEQAHRMTVVSVHPDSASLERHIELGAPEFHKLRPYLALREIEVFGQLSPRAAELVREKAAALGDNGEVRLHTQFAGFGRPSRTGA